MKFQVVPLFCLYNTSVTCASHWLPLTILKSREAIWGTEYIKASIQFYLLSATKTYLATRLGVR